MPDQFRLQAVVNLVKNWSDEWLLRLNIDECYRLAILGVKRVFIFLLLILVL